jgi:hypothetical protein
MARREAFSEKQREQFLVEAAAPGLAKGEAARKFAAEKVARVTPPEFDPDIQSRFDLTNLQHRQRLERERIAHEQRLTELDAKSPTGAVTNEAINKQKNLLKSMFPDKTKQLAREYGDQFLLDAAAESLEQPNKPLQVVLQETEAQQLAADIFRDEDIAPSLARMGVAGPRFNFISSDVANEIIKEEKFGLATFDETREMIDLEDIAVNVLQTPGGNGQMFENFVSEILDRKLGGSDSAFNQILGQARNILFGPPEQQPQQVPGAAPEAPEAGATLQLTQREKAIAIGFALDATEGERLDLLRKILSARQQGVPLTPRQIKFLTANSEVVAKMMRESRQVPGAVGGIGGGQ